MGNMTVTLPTKVVERNPAVAAPTNPTWSAALKTSSGGSVWDYVGTSKTFTKPKPLAGTYTLKWWRNGDGGVLLGSEVSKTIVIPMGSDVIEIADPEGTPEIAYD